MTLAALFAIASAGFVAPGSLSISTACSRRGRAEMLFGRKASGGDLAAVGHEDAVEVTLTGALSLSNRQLEEQLLSLVAVIERIGAAPNTSGRVLDPRTRAGGQRRKLRDVGKSLQSFAVADVQQAVSDVQSMLASELVKLKFVSCEKKPDAQVLANELAAMTGAAVAECIGNECLLYRPPRAGQAPKYAI